MIAHDEGNSAVTPRVWERLLGGGLLFGAFLMLVIGFGTSRSDGSFGTFAIAVALGGAGVWLIRGTHLFKR
ncbi:hypothetical protein GTW64_33370 [Streptomyces sp. SID4923]|nr:hypothetical protein [Streptomyces sp. SID4923]